MQMKTVVLLILLVLMGCSCKNTSNGDAADKGNIDNFVPKYTPGPQVHVYKTKGDYDNLVPVNLNDDKSEIASYPSPDDVYVDGVFPIPMKLNNGYLLDLRGINLNVAFLKMSYGDYASLDTMPSPVFLYENIIDKDPLIELIDCGNRTAFTNLIEQLNRLIDEGKLRKVCKVIK